MQKQTVCLLVDTVGSEKGVGVSLEDDGVSSVASYCIWDSTHLKLSQPKSPQSWGYEETML